MMFTKSLILLLLCFSGHVFGTAQGNANSNEDQKEENILEISETEMKELKSDKKNEKETSYPLEEVNAKDKNFLGGDMKLSISQQAELSIKPHDEITSKGSTGKRTVMKSATFTINKWSGNTIQYDFEKDYKLSLKGDVQAALDYMQRQSCVKFEKKSYNHKGSYIRFVNDVGCSSYIGKIEPKDLPAEERLDGEYKGQPISIPNGCQSRGTIVHEVLHSLGFIHEHSRPDRDEYVTINWENIKKDEKHNFDKEAEEDVKTYGEKYDFDSVMHYPSDAFGVKDRENGGLKETISVKVKEGLNKLGQRAGLSYSDCIRLNKLLGCGREYTCKKKK